MKQVIFTSATPGQYEKKESTRIVEQIVRPTGLIDPEVIIRPVNSHTYKTGLNSSLQKGTQRIINEQTFEENQLGVGVNKEKDGSGKTQIEDLLGRIPKVKERGERVLVTTLTKRMAEDLNDYLLDLSADKAGKKIKSIYLHSEVDTLERIRILTDFRKGKYDILIGVNLLREGLDLPEVSLVAILDADKEGFLRSETSLIQTIGRAARNVLGQVIIYADTITGSIKRAVSENNRRREIQLAYNAKHGITPVTIKKEIRNILEEFGLTDRGLETKKSKQKIGARLTSNDVELAIDSRPREKIIKEKKVQMKIAAQNLEFELAAILRDQIKILERSGSRKTS